MNIHDPIGWNPSRGGERFRDTPKNQFSVKVTRKDSAELIPARTFVSWSGAYSYFTELCSAASIGFDFVREGSAMKATGDRVIVELIIP